MSSKVRGSLFGFRDCFLVSIYAPPNNHSSQGAASGFVEAMVASRVQDSHMWFFGGDFNETPNDSVVAETVEALGVLCSPWGPQLDLKVNREIDWFCSNHPQKVSQVTSPVYALSDHRILAILFMCLFHVRKEGSCRKLRCFAVLKTFQLSCGGKNWMTVGIPLALGSCLTKWLMILALASKISGILFFRLLGIPFWWPILPPKNRRFKHKGVVASVQQRKFAGLWSV